MDIEETRAWSRSEDTLQSILSLVNQSCRREEQVERCDWLSKAVNKAANCYFQHRTRLGQLNETEKKKGRSDNQAIRELLLRGLSVEGVDGLCRSEPLRRIAELKPYILNHETLLREGYDPNHLTDRIEREASDQHRQLENAFRRYVEAPADETLRESLVKKVAQILYIVRNNIAHSEKTPKGPDLIKRERDRLVSGIAADVFEELFDLLFSGHTQRLAVYGTLAPGGTNASQLASLGGRWEEGTARGRLSLRDGLHSFRWEYPGDDVAVNVICSPALRRYFPVLDKFEGPRYQRSLVPIRQASGLSVCNIYEGRS